MPKLLWWAVAIVVAAFAMDRLLLWMESSGWIHYRRTGLARGASVYHLLEMSSVFDPGIQQVIEIMVEEERRQDKSGDPPTPEQQDEPSA